MVSLHSGKTMLSTHEKENGCVINAKKAAVVLLGALVLLGYLTSKSSRLRAVESEGAAKKSLNTLSSCPLVLAPLSGDKPIDAEIARLQRQASNEKERGSSLGHLGWTFIKKARATFDPGFYKLAEQCAACMEASGGTGPDALLLRAHALQSLHRFSEAEAAARELVKMRERPFDYGVLGDVLADEGKIREGAAAYQKMVDLRPDLQSYARAAYVRWLTGALAGAIYLMRLAVTSSSPNDSEAGAWTFTRLALYQLQRGTTNSALASCA